MTTGVSRGGPAAELPAIASFLHNVLAIDKAYQEALALVDLRDARPSLAVWGANFKSGTAYASSALNGLIDEELNSEALSSIAKWILRLHPEDKDVFEALVAQKEPSIEKQKIHKFSMLLRVRSTKNLYRYCMCTGVIDPAQKKDDEPNVVMLVEDSTEANISRIELGYAREFGEKVVRSTINGIIGFDSKLRIIEFNPAIEQMFGVARINAVGRNIFDVLPFLRETHDDCFYYDTLAGKKQTSYDRPYVRIDNAEEGFCRASYIPIFDAEKMVTGGLVVVAETTFERQNQSLQHLLLEASTKLAQVHDPDAVLDVLLRLAVPQLCDWCVVFLDKGARFFSRHHDNELAQRLEHLVATHTATLRPFLSVPPTKAQDGHSATEVVEEIPQSLFRLIKSHPQIGEDMGAIGLASYFRVALTSQGEALGTMTFCMSHEKMGERHRAVAELVALRGALALSNALLIEQAQKKESTLMRIEQDVLEPLKALGLLEGPRAAALETDAELTKLLASLSAQLHSLLTHPRA